MARLPRIAIPGYPHHVTQRGNRRNKVFFEEGDYALYLDLLSEAAQKTEIWCYCLMSVKVAPVLERYGDFKEFLSETSEDSAAFMPLRQSETTGRPLGSEEWIDKIEKVIGRTLKPQKRGPRKKTKSNK